MGNEKPVKDEDLKKISGAGTLGSEGVSKDTTGGTFDADPTSTFVSKSTQVLPGDDIKSPKTGDDLGSTKL
jgi:hypothetical protein